MAIQKKSLLLSLFVLLFANAKAQTNEYHLSSPAKNIAVTVSAGKKISYTVSYKGKIVLLPSEIALGLNDGKVLGEKNTVTKTEQRSVNKDVKPLYGMAQVYKDLFNELTISFNNNYQLIFRAYNNGVAYRFVTSIPGTIQVKEENINYRFASDVEGFIQTTNSYQFSYEAEFLKRNISSLTKKNVRRYAVAGGKQRDKNCAYRG
jgi:alpha-glucosidase